MLSAGRHKCKNHGDTNTTRTAANTDSEDRDIRPVPATFVRGKRVPVWECHGTEDSLNKCGRLLWWQQRNWKKWRTSMAVPEVSVPYCLFLVSLSSLPAVTESNIWSLVSVIYKHRLNPTLVFEKQFTSKNSFSVLPIKITMYTTR